MEMEQDKISMKLTKTNPHYYPLTPLNTPIITLQVPSITLVQPFYPLNK